MTRPSYPRFWSDDFDMDLPKVLPNLDELLGDAASVPLWTYGGTSHDRLNHPACWNIDDGDGEAFFGTDDSGTWKPPDFYTSRPLIECTWREAVRDAWPHGYLLVVNGRPVWHTESLQQAFMELMYDLRGWRALPAGRADELKAMVADSLRAATERIVEEAERVPNGPPTPDEHLATLRREADARSARLAAELTVQMDWPHCPKHVIPLRDDATCGQCSPAPDSTGRLSGCLCELTGPAAAPRVVDRDATCPVHGWQDTPEIQAAALEGFLGNPVAVAYAKARATRRETSAQDPDIRAAILAGHVGQVVIFCDGCGVEEAGDYTGETREIRFAAARRHLAETKGWSVAAPDDVATPDLCPTCQEVTGG